MSIFVEGATEQAFLVKFVKEIAGEHLVEVAEFKISGGSSYPRTLARISAQNKSTGKPYYVQILDCGADHRVASDVRENYASLIKQGFTSIIAVRDVYPVANVADVPTLRSGLHYGIKTSPIRPVFVLGVMEIESWFLGETSHFERLDARLNRTSITGVLGFDPWVIHPETRPKPSDDLAKIYASVGLGYSKKKHQVQRTVNALDYADLYLNTRGIADLDDLSKELNRFFTGDTPAAAA